MIGLKIHPQTIVAGWRKATDEARRALTEAAVDNGLEIITNATKFSSVSKNEKGPIQTR